MLGRVRWCCGGTWCVRRINKLWGSGERREKWCESRIGVFCRSGERERERERKKEKEIGICT